MGDDQAVPRGQSRGNQNIGACRVSTVHTRGSSSFDGPSSTRWGRKISIDGFSL